MPALYLIVFFLAPLEPADTLASADQLYQTGEYRAAAALYDRLAAIAPRQPQFYRNQGRLHLLAGEVPEAILAYRRGQRVLPLSADDIVNLEDAWRQAGDDVGVSAWGMRWRTPFWLVPQHFWCGLASAAWCLGWFVLVVSRRFRYATAIMLAWGAVIAVIFALHQRGIERCPFLVVAADEVVLRQGNGPSYPAKLSIGHEVKLHAGTEGRLRGERSNGWVQIELPDGQIGWVQRQQVLIDD